MRQIIINFEREKNNMTLVATRTGKELFPATLIKGYRTRIEYKKSTDFKNRNKRWSKCRLNWWQFSGGVLMDIIREHKPQTFEEWCTVYFTHCKSWEEVKALGFHWSLLAGNLSEKDGITEVIIHYIDETWEGYESELIVERKLKKIFDPISYKVREATAFEDMNYAVDFVIEDDEGYIYQGIQVKPSSFFYSDRITKVRAEYVAMNKMFSKKNNVPVFYVDATQARRDEELVFIPIENIRVA